MWEFVLALPNLRISVDPDSGDQSQFPSGITLDSGTVRITGGEDPAVLAIRRSSPPVEQILSSFRDEYGNAYVPAVMLVRSDAPDKLKRSAAAFTDFRNAVAMSMVLPGRAAYALGSGNTRPNWADTFDFHPAQVGQRGNVVIQSPALTNLVGEEALFLSPSPAVSIHDYSLHPDRYLYRCLGREWRRRYVKPATNDVYSRRLFRSLEVAYQAASVGVKTFGSPVEYGTQVALWVSAIEILAWTGRANLPTVIALLEKAPVRGASAHRRYKTKWGGKVFRLNAIQHCYDLIYGARSHFLHGDPVSFTTLLHGRKGRQLSLPTVAALIYRYALVGYLSERYKRTESMQTIARDIIEMVDESSYEQAVAKLLGLKMEGWRGGRRRLPRQTSQTTSQES